MGERYVVTATGAAAEAAKHYSSSDTVGDEAEGHVHAPSLPPFVFALFFIFGGITSLNDVLIPKL